MRHSPFAEIISLKDYVFLELLVVVFAMLMGSSCLTMRPTQTEERGEREDLKNIFKLQPAAPLPRLPKMSPPLPSIGPRNFHLYTFSFILRHSVYQIPTLLIFYYFLTVFGLSPNSVTLGIRAPMCASGQGEDTMPSLTVP